MEKPVLDKYIIKKTGFRQKIGKTYKQATSNWPLAASLGLP